MVVARDGGDGDRLAGRDLRRVLGHPPGGRSSASCRACTIRHTSEHEVGQIYVPAVNWGIAVAVVALVVGFGSSQQLASAYGIAVTGTLAIDTILFFVVVRVLWHKPLWLAIAGAAAFLVVDLAFFAANLTKVLHGGWFPLLIAACVFTVLTTWQRGRELVTGTAHRGGGPAARLHPRRPRDASRRSTAPPGTRGLPQRQPRDDPAGAARERRAQPRAARAAS